jgi:hypothetical protein
MMQRLHLHHTQAASCFRQHQRAKALRGIPLCYLTPRGSPVIAMHAPHSTCPTYRSLPTARVPNRSSCPSAASWNSNTCSSNCCCYEACTRVEACTKRHRAVTAMCTNACAWFQACMQDKALLPTIVCVPSAPNDHRASSPSGTRICPTTMATQRPLPMLCRSKRRSTRQTYCDVAPSRITCNNPSSLGGPPGTFQIRVADEVAHHEHCSVGLP